MQASSHEYLCGRADVTVALERVDTAEDAQRLGFRGSPTILVDGDEPFAEGAEVGLARRLFSTPDGPQGAPTVDRLRALFAR